MASNFFGFIVKGGSPQPLPDIEPGEEMKITNAALSGNGRASVYIHHGDEKFLVTVLDDSKNLYHANLEVVLGGDNPVPIAFSVEATKGASVHLTGFTFFNPSADFDESEEDYSFDEDSEDDGDESDESDEDSVIGIEEIKDETPQKKPAAPPAKVKVIPGGAAKKENAPAAPAKQATPAAPAKQAGAPAKQAGTPAKPAGAPAKQAPPAKKAEESDDSDSDDDSSEEAPKAKAAQPSGAPARCDPCGKNFTSQVGLNQHADTKHKAAGAQKQGEASKKAPETPKKAQEPAKKPAETPKKAPETPKKEEGKKPDNTPKKEEGKKPDNTPKAQNTPKKEGAQKPKHVDTPKPKPAADDKKRKPFASQGNVSNKKPKMDLD